MSTLLAITALLAAIWFWLDSLRAREIATGIRLANAYPDVVVAVSVGNEALAPFMPTYATLTATALANTHKPARRKRDSSLRAMAVFATHCAKRQRLWAIAFKCSACATTCPT